METLVWAASLPSARGAAAAAAPPMGLEAADAGVGDWCAAVAASKVLVAEVGNWCG